MKTLDELKEHFSDIEFNETYLKIIEEVQKNPRCRINVVGEGGVGKSVLLKVLHYMLNDDKNVVVCSSTGVSSANLNINNPEVKATTVHSLFKMGARDIYGSFESSSYKREHFEMLGSIDYLMVDEVSMLSSDCFDYFNQMLHYSKGTRPIGIILFNDPLQLPPVIKTNDEDVMSYYDSVYSGKYYYFNSNYYQDNHYKVFMLKKVYRQNGDDDFKKVLNNIRVGKQTQEDLNFLNKRVIDEDEWFLNNETFLRIVSTNKDVQKYNKIALDSLDGKYIVLNNKITGNFKDTLEFKSGLFPEETWLKIGCQVMITRNAPKDEFGEREYVNGDMGILKECNENYAIVELKDREVRVEPSLIENYEYVIEYNNGKAKVTPNVVGSWNGICMRPCSASTIHKTQSQTLSCGYISLGWFKPENGIYVALSRFRNMESFGLQYPIKMEDIKINEEALQFVINEEYKMEVERQMMGEDIESVMNYVFEEVNPKVKLIKKFMEENKIKFKNGKFIDLEKNEEINL